MHNMCNLNCFHKIFDISNKCTNMVKFVKSKLSMQWKFVPLLNMHNMVNLGNLEPSNVTNVVDKFIYSPRLETSWRLAGLAAFLRLMLDFRQKYLYLSPASVEYRNGWLIRTTTKSFAVYAATSTEKQEWMAHINKCIEDLLRKSTLRISSIEH